MTTPYPLAGQRALAEVVSPGTWIAVSGGVGFTNSWSNTGAGVPNAQYRYWQLLNSVEVIGDVSHASNSGSSSPFTLPSALIPANQQIYPVYLVCTGGYANGTSPPLVTLTGSGQINIQGMPAGTTRVAFHCFFSLDA
jgi:hypothetical protein